MTLGRCNPGSDNHALPLAGARQEVKAQVEVPKRHLVFCTPGTDGDADVVRLRQSSVLLAPLVEVR